MRYLFVFLMIRRPPGSPLSSSSAASDVYKRQPFTWVTTIESGLLSECEALQTVDLTPLQRATTVGDLALIGCRGITNIDLTPLANVTVFGHHFMSVSYTHLRAHETPEHLVCRLLLEKKKKTNTRPLLSPI
eukprot:TRINITY_DN52665_c0_g1_i1.p1 TRINITY_DN52665_c0_g1~~TRINITY_DN52665_c0_g1_i1.p1  ORF type:complete len:132 (-),score=21.99 TRINITY_DN52665_c0_g1_i1:61-456(-)